MKQLALAPLILIQWPSGIPLAILVAAPRATIVGNTEVIAPVFDSCQATAKV
ncbi:hypothetical protein [Ralstonia solanacearum]|uniref:hypothetical protein n=1 Tax=Ralstonia solanacearum TaxID=305 RepID=UPI0002FC8C21|nr:hypothetical protein [Ralstonia solanacearum]MDC6180022.1 hypothetical protein [Ralstonia solanacearum]MDC6212598.1 hypothetical protein [Ralstonia solanacearum]MDC6241473.1 hypothetical protein [Ralstonia solanacearum]MDD7800860.1 hypothetical protein [Ralstonia solanacearum]